MIKNFMFRKKANMGLGVWLKQQFAFQMQSLEFKLQKKFKRKKKKAKHKEVVKEAAAHPPEGCFAAIKSHCRVFHFLCGE
jgi:hypothetical protein